MEKKKLFILIGTLLFAFTAVGGAFGLRYFFSGSESEASLEENPPQNIRLGEVNPTDATITWTTDEPDYGYVSYGETMGLGLTVQTQERGTIHSVALGSLSPGTTYYYKVGVGTETYDNQGVPYSFTTPRAVTPPAGGGGLSEPAALSEQAIKDAIGTDDPDYDLNGDGVVNGMDLMIFRKGAY